MRSTSARKRSAVRKKISRSTASRWLSEQSRAKYSCPKVSPSASGRSTRSGTQCSWQANVEKGSQSRLATIVNSASSGGTTTRAALEAAQHLANAQLFPQGPGDVDHAQGAGPLEVDRLARWRDLSGPFEAAVADPADTAGQPEQGRAIERTGPAAVMDDLGGRPALLGVPAGLRQLVILHDRSVLVAASGRSQVHA